MKKLFGLLAIIGLLFVTSCKKEEITPINKSLSELNGEWDVIEKGVLTVSVQSDTTVSFHKWDGIDPLGTVVVSCQDYESVGSIVNVDNVEYELDEWEFSSTADEQHARYIWLNHPNPSDGQASYYVLAKKTN